MKIDLYLPEKLNNKLIAKLERLDELEALSTGTGSLASDGPRVRTSSRSEGGFENIIVKKAELERNIAALRERKDKASADILKVAERLPERQEELLIYRHVLLMPILWMAERYGRSYRTIQRWLKEARKAFNDEAAKI